THVESRLGDKAERARRAAPEAARGHAYHPGPWEAVVRTLQKGREQARCLGAGDARALEDAHPVRPRRKAQGADPVIVHDAEGSRAAQGTGRKAVTAAAVVGVRLDPEPIADRPPNEAAVVGEQSPSVGQDAVEVHE